MNIRQIEDKVFENNEETQRALAQIGERLKRMEAEQANTRKRVEDLEAKRLGVVELTSEEKALVKTASAAIPDAQRLKLSMDNLGEAMAAHAAAVYQKIVDAIFLCMHRARLGMSTTATIDLEFGNTPGETPNANEIRIPAVMIFDAGGAEMPTTPPIAAHVLLRFGILDQCRTILGGYWGKHQCKLVQALTEGRPVTPTKARFRVCSVDGGKARVFFGLNELPHIDVDYGFLDLPVVEGKAARALRAGELVDSDDVVDAGPLALRMAKTLFGMNSIEEAREFIQATARRLHSQPSASRSIEEYICAILMLDPIEDARRIDDLARAGRDVYGYGVFDNAVHEAWERVRDEEMARAGMNPNHLIPDTEVGRAAMRAVVENTRRRFAAGMLEAMPRVEPAIIPVDVRPSEFAKAMGYEVSPATAAIVDKFAEKLEENPDARIHLPRRHFNLAEWGRQRMEITRGQHVNVDGNVQTPVEGAPRYVWTNAPDSRVGLGMGPQPDDDEVDEDGFRLDLDPPRD